MKVGSRVKVVDSTKEVTSYLNAFTKMGLKNSITKRDIHLFLESSFVLFSKFDDSDNNNGIICGIIDKKGNQFLVREEGLEKIKKPKKVKEEPKYKSFPKLMKSKDSDLLVLFESEGYGQVVKSDDNHIIGRISKYWAMEEFKDIDAELKIKYNK